MMANGAEIFFVHMNLIIMFHDEASECLIGLVCLFVYFRRSVNSLLLRKFYIENHY
jgi:hypothetical protein